MEKLEELLRRGLHNDEDALETLKLTNVEPMQVTERRKSPSTNLPHTYETVAKAQTAAM